MAKRSEPKVPIKPQRAVSLSGFYRHFDVEECLCFFSVALAKAGLKENALHDYQQRLFSDLHEPLDEETLAGMLSYWEYDLSRLVDRGRRHAPQGAPAKPRIDVLVEITSKGNFKAEWFPHGASDNGSLPAASDFTWFRRYDHRGQAFDTRPSNELFFLRGAYSALAHLDAIGPTRALNHVLLSACAQTLGRLKARLDYHFDVRMLTDIFVEWEEVDDPEGDLGWRDTIPLIKKWEIADPEERRREAEIEELECLEDRHGFSERALTTARDMVRGKARKSGPTPAEHTLPDRIAQELKRQGLSATKRSVERALYLLRCHRPGPEIDNDTPQFRNVVQFPNTTSKR
jgi:hypothetical protein